MVVEAGQAGQSAEPEVAGRCAVVVLAAVVVVMCAGVGCLWLCLGRKGLVENRGVARGGQQVEPADKVVRRKAALWHSAECSAEEVNNTLDRSVKSSR